MNIWNPTNLTNSTVWNQACNPEAPYKYVLGILLAVGAIVSYFPQFYSLLKSKNHQGISEFSLWILCLSYYSLIYNVLVLNWWKFQCYKHCSFWVCTANLMSIIPIIIGFLMAFPLYILFTRYKIKNSDRKVIHDLVYILVFILFIMTTAIIALSEKYIISNSGGFFKISAWIAGGVISPLCSCLVWVPQIVYLIKTKQQGCLSLVMFMIQTPGNIVNIVFQLLYHQNWTTWVSYVVTLVEQTIIIVILLVLKYKKKSYDLVSAV